MEDDSNPRLSQRILQRTRPLGPALQTPTVDVGSYFKGMSKMQSWMLWQRLPPRYQLTSRLLEDDDEIDITVSNSIEKFPNTKVMYSAPRPNSGMRPYSGGRRPLSGTPRSPRQNYQNEAPSQYIQKREQRTYVHSSQFSQKENFMLSSGINISEPSQSQMLSSSKQLPIVCSFPKRKSDYINTFQKQKRVNSARRRFSETPSAAMNNTQQRAHTAPVFPVTSEGVRDNKPKVSDTNPPADSKNLTTSRPSTKRSPKEIPKVNMFQFDDSKQTTSNSEITARNSKERMPKPKKYEIQDTDKGTMYIDNGKVICFGKSRHDLTQLLKTQSLRSDRSSCFLAALRRDYLKHPKYESRKTSRSKKVDEPRRIAHERVDYNKKVEHILNYYSDDEDTPRSPPPSGYRARSPKGGRMRGLALTYGAPSRPLSRSGSPVLDRPESPSDFIRLNKKSKLHDRQFYLQTPRIEHDTNAANIENCRCSMCRMEIQMALVDEISSAADKSGVTSVDKAKPILTAAKLAMQTIDIVSAHNQFNAHKAVDKHHATVNHINGNKHDVHKVKFHQPEVTSTKSSSPTNEHTLTITCTLPDVDNMTINESDLESFRTQGDVTACPSENDTDLL